MMRALISAREAMSQFERAARARRKQNVPPVNVPPVCNRRSFMTPRVFECAADSPGLGFRRLKTGGTLLHTCRMSHQTFVCTHRVTYAECTMGNHVYYARYLDFLEAARGEFFRALGTTFQQWQDADTVFPVIEARLRYKSAARYDDVLRIEIWLTEVERVRLTFAHRILDESGKLRVEAHTQHACTSVDDKLKRLPEDLVAKLQPYLQKSR
jgi:acyl-CoA thioester hydrolase